MKDFTVDDRRVGKGRLWRYVVAHRQFFEGEFIIDLCNAAVLRHPLNKMVVGSRNTIVSLLAGRLSCGGLEKLSQAMALAFPDEHFDAEGGRAFRQAALGQIAGQVFPAQERAQVFAADAQGHAGFQGEARQGDDHLFAGKAIVIADV